MSSKNLFKNKKLSNLNYTPIRLNKSFLIIVKIKQSYQKQLIAGCLLDYACKIKIR